MEVGAANFHFVGMKWKFEARTSISSGRNGSWSREHPLNRGCTRQGIFSAIPVFAAYERGKKKMFFASVSGFDGFRGYTSVRGNQ
jgi:hypothetical protein